MSGKILPLLGMIVSLVTIGLWLWSNWDRIKKSKPVQWYKDLIHYYKWKTASDDAKCSFCYQLWVDCAGWHYVKFKVPSDLYSYFHARYSCESCWNKMSEAERPKEYVPPGRQKGKDPEEGKINMDAEKNRRSFEALTECDTSSKTFYT